MKYIIYSILVLLSNLTIAQSVNFGAATSVNVEGNAKFHLQGNAMMDGLLSNDGETIIDGDVLVNNVIDNSGQLEVGKTASFTASSSLLNNAESVLSILGNGTFDGNVENNGLVDIFGTSSISLSALLNNNDGSVWSSAGDATLDGTIANSGIFHTGANSIATVNGVLDSNNELNFEGDLDVSGIVNNIGAMNVLGDMSVQGTGLYTNQLGGLAAINGNFTQVSPFENEGIIEIIGDATFSENFANRNESAFLGSTSFEGTVANEQNIYLGGDSEFLSDLLNNGEIISVADAQLNFEQNRNLGNLGFSDLDQVAPITEVVILSSTDSIFIAQLKMDIEGKVTMPNNFVLIQDELSIVQGVLNTTNQENFLVTGTVNVSSASSNAPAYIEGKMLAVTSENGTTFPMGINGFPNYVTLKSSKAGVPVKVECRTPDLDSLLTDENTMGLAQEVEWTIQTLTDSVEVIVSVEYSGVDFTNAPNFINAREYDATLQKYDSNDSLYHALRTIESANANIGTEVPTEGTIKTSDKIWVSIKPSKFALGISPVLTQPEVYVPNVFTPQASLSDNQIFRPFIGGATINVVNFIVYDSFNSEIYSFNQSGEDIDLEGIGWDGVLKSGQDAPEGVYYYNISLEYLISDDVSDKYFNSGERGQTQTFSKLGSVMLVK